MRETHPKVRNWSGHTHGGPELARRPSRRSKTGRGILPEVWKCSEDPPGEMEVVGTHSRRS